MVRLKGYIVFVVVFFHHRFNSKMVRLKEMKKEREVSFFPCFNSKMVRLKGICPPQRGEVYFVSIPKWYD